MCRQGRLTRKSCQGKTSSSVGHITVVRMCSQKTGHSDELGAGGGRDGHAGRGGETTGENDKDPGYSQDDEKNSNSTSSAHEDRCRCRSGKTCTGLGSRERVRIGREVWLWEDIRDVVEIVSRYSTHIVEQCASGEPHAGGEGPRDGKPRQTAEHLVVD